MWQPEPGWKRVPGTGASTAGVWLVEGSGAHHAMAKRIDRPLPNTRATSLLDESHPHYWRREVDVAMSGLLAHTHGVCAPEVLDVVEDASGITLFTVHHQHEELPGLHLAAALGTFSNTPVLHQPWFAHGSFDHRLRAAERRGGWTTLARTTVADVAAELWRRRAGYAQRLREVRQVLHHGDAVRTNFLTRTPEAVLAVDWGSLGTCAAGADLGHLSLGVREGLDHLVDAYVQASGRPEERVDVLHVARIVSVFTVLTRADWALSRAAKGEGALAGKFAHPSVAPYLRDLQSRHEAVAALLGL